MIDYREHGESHFFLFSVICCSLSPNWQLSLIQVEIPNLGSMTAWSRIQAAMISSSMTAWSRIQAAMISIIHKAPISYPLPFCLVSIKYSPRLHRVNELRRNRRTESILTTQILCQDHLNHVRRRIRSWRYPLRRRIRSWRYPYHSRKGTQNCSRHQTGRLSAQSYHRIYCICIHKWACVLS